MRRRRAKLNVYAINPGSLKLSGSMRTVSGPCECADSGCAAHKGRSSCGNRGAINLQRVDMDDPSGTLFCEACAADALSSGLFTSRIRTHRVNPKRVPSRSDVNVDVWEERDRLHIHVKRKSDDSTVAEWWDDDARQMFEDGFFKSGRGFKDSVLDYCAEVGLIR